MQFLKGFWGECFKNPSSVSGVVIKSRVEHEKFAKLSQKVEGKKEKMEVVVMIEQG